MSIEDKIRSIHGPIAVVGSNGFIGKNMTAFLRHHRKDVYEGRRDNTLAMLESVRPKTLFNCSGINGRSAKSLDSQSIYQTNLLQLSKIMDLFYANDGDVFVHCGSSEEYMPIINPYRMSKAFSAQLVEYHRYRGRNAINLKIAHVYGPMDHGSSLISSVIREGLSGNFPKFDDAKTAIDFIYIEDVCVAMALAASTKDLAVNGFPVAIKTSVLTTLEDVAKIAAECMGIKQEPVFAKGDETARQQPLSVSPSLAHSVIGFEAAVSFADGFAKTVEWTRANARPA